MRHRRLAHFAVAIVALLAAASANACICGAANLEQSYDAADNVFTALVTDSRPGGAGDVLSRFNVTEVFKGRIPFSDLRTEPGSSSCGTTLQVGARYLFFVGNDGQIGLCNGQDRLDGARARTLLWLNTLRAFKNGKIDNLAPAWEFSDRRGACGLEAELLIVQTGRRMRMTFAHRYAAAPAPADDGRALKTGAAIARVYWPAPDRRGDKVRIVTPTNTYRAHWQKPRRGVVGSYVVEDRKTRRLIRELARLPAAKVTGKLGALGKSEALLRTTNSALAIEQFLECLDKQAPRQAGS